jgi:hypothetical protein
MKLTLLQKLLLADLPDAPDDGMRCKGGYYRTAKSLQRHGLARCVGGGEMGAYFVRTSGRPRDRCVGSSCSRLFPHGLHLEPLRLRVDQFRRISRRVRDRSGRSVDRSQHHERASSKGR